MDKQLIYFDEASYKSKVGRFELFIQFFEKAIEIYNGFGINEFKPEEFEMLICFTESFVKEKLWRSKDFSAVAGLGLNKSKLLELIDNPVGYGTLMEIEEQIQRFYSNSEVSTYVSNLKELLKFYVFDKSGKINVKPDIIESFKNDFESYVTTEKGKNYYDFAVEFLKLYKKHNIPFSSRMDNIHLIENLFQFEGSEPSLNINFIKMVDRQAKGKS